MERITVAVYRPKPGREAELLAVVKDHMPVLRSQSLVTDRKPIVMKAADGTVIEIFGWKSAEAIHQAHTNPEVQKLWDRFNPVCDFDVPINVVEFQTMFSEFTPVN